MVLVRTSAPSKTRRYVSYCDSQASMTTGRVSVMVSVYRCSPPGLPTAWSAPAVLPLTVPPHTSSPSGSGGGVTVGAGVGESVAPSGVGDDDVGVPDGESVGHPSVIE